MTNLQAKITDFVANHKKFPTTVDLRRANKRLWTELTPQETREFLHEVSVGRYLWSDYDIAFQYWLYWLQAERLRVINGILATILAIRYDCPSTDIAVSRMKAGRRMPHTKEITAFYKLYLLSPSEIKQLKQEVIQNGNST